MPSIMVRTEKKKKKITKVHGKECDHHQLHPFDTLKDLNLCSLTFPLQNKQREQQFAWNDHIFIFFLSK